MSENPEISIPRVGNAAGTCNRPEHFKQLLRSAVDTIMVGPMSVLPRQPNPGGENAYRDHLGRSINSKGLPNGSIQWFREHFPHMKDLAKAAGKRLTVTIPPINEGDIKILAEACAELGVEIAEINFGCNHVFINGVQKDPLSYYPEELGSATAAFIAIVGDTMEVNIKLSPQLPRVPTALADAIRPHRVGIVTCNTVGNAFMFTEQFLPAINFGQNLGGYGGTGIHPIMLGQVRQLRLMLPDHKIIATGGITDGFTAWSAMSVGADELQIGSEWYFSEEARIFSDVPAQYIELVEQHPLWRPHIQG